ncbi:hypothetical protein E2I00_000347 [Balaenoptera physalus]|uniref:Thiamine pyrophosphate enzyme central domain-containing protein n=1 Tax=Balaenoptera physalus TaxID=9770 RepID=A0A6A1QAB7_BALPH|nr:hypothetical protein E2I00_000347 [Balaenoptera physalus]
MSESNLAERSDGRERLVSGAKVVAQALKTQDVNYMFGIVGIPACYAASAVGYLTGRYVECCMPPPVSMAESSAVCMAASVIRNAKQPLLIIGKGAAYARAEESIRKLVEQCKLPFLPTPMGKGVIPDNHPNCVGAARSRALQFADVIVLFGARLNWILHFGLPPRYQPDVKFIQVDICAEELGNNVRPAVTLLGDINAVTKQLLEQFEKTPWQYPPESKWWKILREKMKSNEALSKRIFSIDLVPPMCLLPHSHYEHVMTAFGGKGYFVQTPEELQKSLRQSLADTTKPCLINIMIEPQAMRKAQDFHWLTRSNM